MFYENKIAKFISKHFKNMKVSDNLKKLATNISKKCMLGSPIPGKCAK